jgi:hypothetical protein
MMLLPILVMLSHGRTEAKISADEFQAALLLSEMADQVALIRQDELPAADGTHDLRAAGVHVLRADRSGSWLELSPLPASFEVRELVLEPAPASSPRGIRMRVGYRRPRGALKFVESMTLVHPALARATN